MRKTCHRSQVLPIKNWFYFLFIFNIVFSPTAHANTQEPATRAIEFTGNLSRADLFRLLEKSSPNTRILDVRSEKKCLNLTIEGATCLPVENMFADHGRLSNFSGLFWLLGTIGLTGTESVVVVGDTMQRKQTVAGWLHASGQHRVLIHSAAIGEIISTDRASNDSNAEVVQTAAGRLPSRTRTSVYTAVPRTQLLLTLAETASYYLPTDLEPKPTIPILLDGRPESEYWGRRIRATRGGHIPGALLMNDSSRDMAELKDQSLVVYGHDSAEGFSLLANLVARGLQASVYLSGWSEWSAHAEYAADAETFPKLSSIQSIDRQSPVSNDESETPLIAWGGGIGNFELSTFILWFLVFVNLVGIIYFGLRQRQH